MPSKRTKAVNNMDTRKAMSDTFKFAVKKERERREKGWTRREKGESGRLK